MSPEFLDVDDVLEIHAIQLEEFGGLEGVRDRGLLESAVAQARASFGGEFLHGDLFLMAAAYLYHIASNHSLIDGNKRTDLVAALTFLAINGLEITRDSPLLYNLTMDAAENRVDKDEIADVLRALVR